jgi:hypothetical protein
MQEPRGNMSPRMGEWKETGIFSDFHPLQETQQAIEDWHYWVNRGYEF